MTDTPRISPVTALPIWVRDWWKPIDTAPRQTLVLVWGNGGVRFGYWDEHDCWRSKHHGPIRGTPKFWMPLPPPPHEEIPQ